MLRSRTSDTAGGATIEGDRSGFARLGALIIEGHGRLDLDQVGDPSPYARWLTGIVVRRGDAESVTVGYSDDRLDLTIGCPEPHVEAVAWNIAGCMLDAAVGYHRHEEAYPEHFYLDERAVPLVVERI